MDPRHPAGNGLLPSFFLTSQQRPLQMLSTLLILASLVSAAPGPEAGPDTLVDSRSPYALMPASDASRSGTSAGFGLRIQESSIGLVILTGQDSGMGLFGGVEAGWNFDHRVPSNGYTTDQNLSHVRLRIGAEWSSPTVHGTELLLGFGPTMEWASRSAQRDTSDASPTTPGDTTERAFGLLGSIGVRHWFVPRHVALRAAMEIGPEYRISTAGPDEGTLASLRSPDWTLGVDLLF